MFLRERFLFIIFVKSYKPHRIIAQDNQKVKSKLRKSQIFIKVFPQAEKKIPAQRKFSAVRGNITVFQNAFSAEAASISGADIYSFGACRNYAIPSFGGSAASGPRKLRQSLCIFLAAHGYIKRRKKSLRTHSVGQGQESAQSIPPRLRAVTARKSVTV